MRRICDHLEQNDDYKRFGVDEETPSGVEEFSNYRNSTQIPGSQGLRLHVSSIQEVEEEENVIFDELSRPDDFYEGEGEDEDEEEEDSGENEEEGRQETTEPHSCIECDDEFITRSDLKNHMRSIGFLEFSFRNGILHEFSCGDSWLDDAIIEYYNLVKAQFSHHWTSAHACDVPNCETMMVSDGGCKIMRSVCAAKFSSV